MSSHRRHRPDPGGLSYRREWPVVENATNPYRGSLNLRPRMKKGALLRELLSLEARVVSPIRGK